MKIFMIILMSTTLVCSIDLNAAARGTYTPIGGKDDEAPLQSVILPVLAPLTSLPTAERLDQGEEYFKKAVGYEEGRGEYAKDDRKAVLYFHLAAHSGNRLACLYMQVFCQNSKHGLTPENTVVYDALLPWCPMPTWGLPASGTEAGSSDSTRRASDDAASGGAGSDSSGDRSAASEVRQRKPPTGAS
jgi:TPR repeat protein